MVNVPVITPQVQSQALPTPTLGASIRPLSNPYVAQTGQTQLSQAVNKEAQDFAAQAIERGNQVAMLEAQEQMNAWEAKNLYDPDTGALTRRGKDAFNLPEALGGQYQNDMMSLRENLANDDQRLAFDKMLVQRRDNIMQTLYRHERGEMDNFAKSKYETAVVSEVDRMALNYNNPAVIKSSMDSIAAATTSYGKINGLPPEAITQNILAAESKGHIAILTRMADNDPKEALRYFQENQFGMTGNDLMQAHRLIAPTQRKYNALTIANSVMDQSKPQIERDGIIEYVMDDLEGGDKLIVDNNGAKTIYGINAKWNPDLFEGDKVPDKPAAKERYIRDYWNKIDADDLPADMRLAAFHFAVNAGAEKANELIDKAGNDPRKLIELEAEHYQKLARDNPEKYAGDLAGWMNRLGKVQKQIDMMRGELPDLNELNSMIDRSTDDILVASEAKSYVKSQYDAQKNAIKEREQNASDEAWRYVANGMDVPPSVIANMNAKEADEMITKINPDPEFYERVRQLVLTDQDVDLRAYRWRLGKKYDDLVELQNSPEKATMARSVDDVLKSATSILIGRSAPKTQSDFETVERFRRSVDREIRAEEKRSGRQVTAEQAQQITDKLLLKTDSAMWGRDPRLFEVEPGEEVDIAGAIPANGTHMIGGKPVGQRELLDIISRQLSARGLAVDDDHVSKLYDRMIASGQVKYTYDRINTANDDGYGID